MTFLQVDHLLIAGRVAYARQPGTGRRRGYCLAVRMAQLSGARVQFFTALGRDATGERSLEQLQAHGLEVHGLAGSLHPSGSEHGGPRRRPCHHRDR